MAELFDQDIISKVSDVYRTLSGKPEILLYTPTFNLIGIVECYYNSQCSLRFNDKSELSLTIPYQYYDKNGNQTIQEIYSHLERNKLIRIPQMGWWYIDSIRQSNDGVEKTCTVTAYSYEHTLTLRSVNLYSTNQSDTGTMVLTLYAILTEFKKQTGWNLPQGYYDRPSDYMHSNRQFTIELNTSWYDFLKTTVQEAFDCFIFFDYENFEIDVKLSYSQTYLRTSDIVFSFDNLMKDITTEENSQMTATALYVKGQDCNIADVNPLGTSLVYNFTPYLSETWLSTSTITAINTWQTKINNYKSIYKSLTGFRNSLIEYKISASSLLPVVEGNISKYTDLLGLNDGGSSGGLWTKYGQCFKLYSNMRNILENYIGCIDHTLSVLNTNHSDCYTLLSDISDYTMKLHTLGTSAYPQYRYDYVFNDGTFTGYWKEYQYCVNNLYETLNNDGNINIFKLNKNIYGTEIIDYYTSHGSVPSLKYITDELAWTNNFTTAQLKEIRPYIIDASYHASEYTYYKGLDYVNLIDIFNVQIGKVNSSAVSDISTVPNPDDPWTYGLGYWTTNFIKLPSADLYVRFFDANTGELIKPYSVALYHTTKNSIFYYCDDDGYAVKDKWNEDSATFPDNSKPTYLRASFKYPYEYNSQNLVVPVRSVLAIVGENYANNVAQNLKIQTDLLEQAEQKHEELCLPCRAFSINVANFLQLDGYSMFAHDLCLGTSVMAETSLNHYEKVRLLELNFSFDEIDSLNMVFGNKYGVDNDRIMFRKLVSSSGDTFNIQDSFTSFEFNDNSIERS